jgi:hypothetical protein
MPVDHLAKLAKFFNCRVDDLLNYETPPLNIKGFRNNPQIDLTKKLKLVK